MMEAITNKTYYDILEISPDASLDEIEQAYQRAKTSYGNDNAAMYSLLSDNDCQKILSEVEEAYSVLNNPHKRRLYHAEKGLQQLPEAPVAEEFSGSPTSDLAERIKNVRTNESSTNDLMDPSFYQQDYTIDRNKEGFQYQQAHSARREVTVSKIQANKKFSLDYQRNEDFEQQIENAINFSGNFLKEIREYKKVSIEHLAELTRISKTHLRNIEDDNYDKLPAEVYARGFVFQYAKILKLNPELVASSYMKHYKEAKRA